MPNKSFSIYHSKEDAIADADDRLVLELARTHIACLTKKEHKRTISAFELFSFAENEASDFAKLFKTISEDSKLLTRPYLSAQVFINSELSILVPVFKFNTQIAGDYLNIILGEDPLSKTEFEHLPVEPGMINVYRVQHELLVFLQQHLSQVSFKHTYSNIVKAIVPGISSLPPEYIYIQFYNTFIIVTVIRNEKLQLIQSFKYETPEDVLYHLLNITGHFGLNTHELTLRICGMIDLDFTLYRELITYFRHVEVQNTDSSRLHLDIKEYPLHYFTPFFNLAL